MGLLRYCPICDAFEYRDRDLCVLAQDEKGIRSALFMSHYTPRLKLLLPVKLRCGARLARQIQNAGIQIVRDTLTAMNPRLRPRGVYLHLQKNGIVPCDAAYVELGSRVRDEAFRHLKNLERSETGRLITNSEQRTNYPSLFAVGDCVAQISQISVAAAHAAIAATTIHNDLRWDVF
jgi:thioredoxin reductase (NADPH)